MFQTLKFSMRLCTSSVVFFAGLCAVAPAYAQNGTGHYQATLVRPAEKPAFVARELLWRCTAGICTAAKSGSRPETICAALAKHVGPLSAFTAGAARFDDRQLAACNRRAADDPATIGA